MAPSNKFPLFAAFNTWFNELPAKCGVTSPTRDKVKLKDSWSWPLRALVPLVGEQLFLVAQKTEKKHSESQGSNAHYMPQLDALRAFAVGAVLVHHFSGKTKIGGADFGLLGVWLFFVLSGFLITGILLRSRDQIHGCCCRPHFALRQFYVRRFLRIFPLYYFVLCVAAIFNLGDVRDTIGWHLTYLSNYLFAARGYFGLATAHFWSLSVEEQFYILWPTLIFFTPERFLPKVIIAAIATGPLFRVVVYLGDFNGITQYAVTPASLDTLGLGALLGYASHRIGENPNLARHLNRCSLWLGLPGIILFHLFQILESHELIRPVIRNFSLIASIPWAFCFLWLVQRAAAGFTGLAGTILELKPLTYMGKISYGIYVYHLFVFLLVPIACAKLNCDFSLLSRWTQFGLLAGITIGVAAISWHLFESPLNSVKNYFTYCDRNAGYGNRRAKVA